MLSSFDLTIPTIYYCHLRSNCHTPGGSQISSVISPLEMPAKKQQKRTSRRGGKRIQGLGAPIAFPYPQTTVVTMTYPDHNVISESVVGNGVTYTYALNGLYDPNTTGVGAQPIGFDQFSALYTLFRVVAIDLSVEFICNIAAAASSASNVVGVSMSTLNALPASVQSWPGTPGTRSRMLTNNGQANRVTFSTRVKPWQVAGITKHQYMSSLDYTCTATGSPARNIYAILWSVGYGSAIAVTSYEIRLVYHVQCMQPVLNNLS